MRLKLSICFAALTVFCPNAVRGENPLEIVVGEAQFFNADYVEIEFVTSSGEGFEEGATVTVRGEYTLNSLDSADLCFYLTTSLKPGVKPKATPIQTSQRIKAQRGKHRFTLSQVISEPGNPHITFYDPETGKPFGGVYFGDESNVLMKKSWSYDAP